MMIYPVAIFVVGLLVALAFPSMRKALRDRLALAGFITVPLFWIVFIPECVAFLNLPNSTGPMFDRPDWDEVPLLVAAIGSVVMGLLLLVRAKGARFISAFYIAVNAVCCVWSGSILISTLLDAWL
jgi:hypothetical protein